MKRVAFGEIFVPDFEPAKSSIPSFEVRGAIHQWIRTVWSWPIRGWSNAVVNVRAGALWFISWPDPVK
jgi:hypothetical protein